MGAQTALNQAWAAVNSLGGRAEQDNSYDQGYVDAIGRALEEIEKLGGRDPLECLAPGALPIHADSAKAERERCIQAVMAVDNEFNAERDTALFDAAEAIRALSIESGE